MTFDYQSLTEIPGAKASREQLDRMFARYHFASSFCENKNILEVACGSGQGLGYIAGKAKMVIGGDYTESLLRLAQEHYGSRIPLCRLDAQKLPFKSDLFDVIILYEAIYYLKQPDEFFLEAGRILKPEGMILISLPNKSLPDFHPSPFSHRYYTPHELRQLMEPHGFNLNFFGNIRIDHSSLRYRLFSFLKKSIVKLNLMPGTLKGREFIKRIIYGKLMIIPAELTDQYSYRTPEPLSSEDTLDYRVLFAVARRSHS